MMRFIFITLILSIILGCQQQSNEISQSQEETDLKILWSVDWHPNKDQVIAGGMQDTLRLFSSTNYKPIKNFPFLGTITKSKWHPSKNIVATAVQDRKSKLSILNLDHEEWITLDSITNDGARAIGWNASGNLLAVGDYEGFLTIFDEKGNFQKRVDTQQKGLIGLDWHPEENLIVAVGEKITLYNFDSDSIQHINDRQEEIEVLMLCVAWHPNGKFFVTGDYGDFINHYPPLLQYWTKEGQKIKSIEKSKAEYRNLKWSSDGELLATASEKIRLWNKNGDLIHEKTSDNLLWGIDWNEEANKLVTSDEKGNTIFWDKDLKKLKELNF